MIALAQQSNILDEVIHGEALAVLRTLPDNSVDAIVCDPPAGISFMGKDWDNYSGKQTRDSQSIRDAAPRINRQSTSPFPHGGGGAASREQREAFISFIREVMSEALRVLKPGGHAFVWSLPRTSHWTGIALEDAGFEIRDCVNHFYDASTLMQQFLASLTPSQSDAFKALMDSQSAPSLVSHIFGSGFPKSADISKAIDKMQGAEREYLGPKVYADGTKGHDANYNSHEGWRRPWKDDPEAVKMAKGKTAPATPEASQWNGWGTALKPASEHWWLCRKPLSEKNIAANVLKWGTGAINIDATRVHSIERPLLVRDCKDEVIQNAYGAGLNGSHAVGTTTQGRFPSNLLLSHSVWCVPNGVKRVRSQSGGPIRVKDGLKPHNVYGERAYSEFEPYQDSEGMEQVEDWLCDESCPIRLLDEQSGTSVSSGGGGQREHGAAPNGIYGNFGSMNYPKNVGKGDQGGASRYFQRFSPFIYQAKASRSERNSGCEGLPEGYNDFQRASSGLNQDRPNREGRKPMGPQANSHPTVKPLQLMRYLVRMITPPGGIVLDCFAGSGSTLVAAIHEGMHFIGIEMNDSEQEPYVSIARARIEQAFREVQS